MELTKEQASKDIQEHPNSLVINKCRSYIQPSLTLYEDVGVFTTGLHLFATGIWDDEYGKYKPDHIFMLFVASPTLAKRLESIRELSWYVDDYNVNDLFQMVVVKLPFENITDTFINGDYSKLYDQETAYKIFVKRYSNKQDQLRKLFHKSYSIVTKSEEARKWKEREVNALTSKIGLMKGMEPFEETTYITISPDQEYETFSPILNEEVFNYGKEPTGIKSYRRLKDRLQYSTETANM